MKVGLMARRNGGLARILAVAGLMAATAAAFSAASAQQTTQLPPEPHEAAASLSRAEVPAEGDSDVLMIVRQSGRIRIHAESATGVALQFVDMMAGPGAVSGEAGIRDGAIDELADAGTYKIRSFGAKGGKGNAKLVVQPYRNAAPASSAILRGGAFSGELADLQQRSFWLIVGPSGEVRVDAGGRSLQDLVLWHNGTDRVALTASPASVEPRPGQSLTLMRIDGKVEPGLYLVTAYGGPALPWTDSSKAQPFHIRAGAPDTMAATALEGVIGPLGFARFSVPAPANYLRLELPDPAPARLSARRGGNAQSAAIRKNSRNPVAAFTLPASDDSPAIVEVTGLEGQPFRLRALFSDAPRRTLGQGPYLVEAEFAEAGGEEAPATTLFLDIDEKGASRMIDSDTPRVGGTTSWRSKFNLRGVTTLIVEVTKAGPIAVSSQGPAATFLFEPLLARAPNPAKGNRAAWDAEPGWYWLTIRPVRDAGGVIDLTVGPPGVRAGAPVASPVRQAVLFGQYDFTLGHVYQLFTSSAPGQVIAPHVRPLPVDLSKGAVTIQQPASGDTLSVPVLMPVDGDAAVTTLDGKRLPADRSRQTLVNGQRKVIVDIPATDKERPVTIALEKAEAPLTIPNVEQRALPALAAGKAHGFDLTRGQNRAFRLDVAQGGLYRVETTGRLKTGLTLGTAFLPKIAKADDNGIGHNALLQTYLRAGAYRVNVTAADSDGHLGLVATPAPLPEAGTLVPGGSVRATLAGGRGAVFTVDIPETGDYALDLYGLNRSFTARLEDADGWPLTAPQAFNKIEQKFTAGKYRLVVQPQTVDARAVARLRRTAEVKELKGHGPHPVIFGETRSFQWREPEAKDAPRDPDIWTFALSGPAHTQIDISEGMAADLIRQDTNGERVARIISGHTFSGVLPAGRYALEARALGRNDRLDYELTATTDEIQPGLPRPVELPAKISFAVANDRVVNLATFGGIALQAVLKDASGREIERVTGRDNDWNIALSRYLAAGTYTLELDNAAGAESPRPAAVKDSPDDDETAASGESGDAEQSGDESGNTETPGVEISLALPETAEQAALAFTGQATVTDARVHSFTLPQAEPGTLVLLAAQSAGEVAISVERQDKDGHWQPQGFARGTEPVLALPADTGKTAQWRLSAWHIDGGSAPVTLAARAISQTAQAAGAVKLAPFAIEGFNRPIRIAAVNMPGGELVRIAGRVPDLLQGSAPAKLVRATESGTLALQSERLWLVSRTSETVTLESVSAQNGEIALELGDGEHANLPRTAATDGKIRVWRADSTFGQPSFLSIPKQGLFKSAMTGGTGGIASGSALAMPADGTFLVRNGASGALRLTLKAFDLNAGSLSLLNETSPIALPPRSALTVKLADKLANSHFKHAAITLESGLGAFISGNDRSSVIWAANGTESREISGEPAAITIVNTGDKPATATIALSPADMPSQLKTGTVLKRFFGTAGSLSLAVQASPGDKLGTGGATATFVGEDGGILRGASLTLPGPGSLILDHPAGLVAAWIENGKVSPWPNVAAVAATPPQTLPLDGPAKRFTLKTDAPALLHARTNAPVILTLGREGGQAEPQLYPAGAEFHGFVKAGNVELRIDAPHDGPLSGTLDLSLSPIPAIGEGLGAPVVLAPGTAALFGFEVKKASTIGAGIRSEPDTAMTRILDADGKPIGHGAVQMQKLAAGHYYLEARTPATGGAVTVRPALIGLDPPPSGPPADILHKYLDMVGKTRTAR